MLLTYDYSQVISKRRLEFDNLTNFSGWLTPEGKFLPLQSGSHYETLRVNDIKIDLPDNEVVSLNILTRQGFVRMIHNGNLLNCELHYSQLSRVQKRLENILNNSVDEVEFELLSDSGKITSLVVNHFKNGHLFTLD
jgi:hypothetical protein